jgi:hypothetical protein
MIASVKTTTTLMPAAVRLPPLAGRPHGHPGRRPSPEGASPRRRAPSLAVLETTTVPPLPCWLYKQHQCWPLRGLQETSTRRDP